MPDPLWKWFEPPLCVFGFWRLMVEQSIAWAWLDVVFVGCWLLLSIQAWVRPGGALG